MVERRRAANPMRSGRVSKLDRGRVTPTGGRPAEQTATGALVDLQASIGNRGVGRLLGPRATRPLGFRPRLQRKVDSTEDPLFNLGLRVAQLAFAIDQQQISTNWAGFPIGRKIDYEKVVAALEDLTPSQARRVVDAYGHTHGSLEFGLFGVGTTLKAPQVKHLRVLLEGTVSEPAEADPWGDGTLIQSPDDLRTHARADAAKIDLLLADADDNADKREQLMLMLRRPAQERDALERAYLGVFFVELPVALAAKLSKAHNLRAQSLLSGNFAGADAVAIEEKRKAIAEIDDKLEDLEGGKDLLDPLGIIDMDQVPAVGPVAKLLRAQRAELVGGIDSILETTRAEVRAEQAELGAKPDEANEAVRTRISAIMLMGDPKNTLADRLRKTLGDEADFVVDFSLADPAEAAARRLLRANSGKPRSADLTAELRKLRQSAESEVAAEIKALAVRVSKMPISKTEQGTIVTALLTSQQERVSKRADSLMQQLGENYNSIRGNARSLTDIMSSGSDTDQELAKTLRATKGELSDVDELVFATTGGNKDIETVKRVLKRVQPSNLDAVNREYMRRTHKHLRDVVPSSDRVEALGALRQRDDKGADEFQTIQAIRWQRQNAKVEAGLTGWIKTGSEADTILTTTLQEAEQLYLEIVRLRSRPDLRAEYEAARVKLQHIYDQMNFVRHGYDSSVAELRESLTFVVNLALDVAITVFFPPGKIVQLAASLAKNIAVNAIDKGDQYNASMFGDDLLNGLLSMGGGELGAAAFRTGLGGVKGMVAKSLVSEAGKRGVQISSELKMLAAAGSWAGENVASTVGGQVATGGPISIEGIADGLKSGLATHTAVKGTRKALNQDRNNFEKANHGGAVDTSTGAGGRGGTQSHDAGATTSHPVTVGGSGANGGGGAKPKQAPRHGYAEIITQAGGWAKAVEGKHGSELAAHRKALAWHLKERGGSPSKSASTERGSDIDVSFPDGKSMIAAREWLDSYQPGWQHFSIGLMVDAGRLNVHKAEHVSLGDTTAGKAQAERIDAKTDSYILARDLRNGRSVDVEARLKALPEDQRIAVEAFAALKPADRRAQHDSALLEADIFIERMRAEMDPVKKAELAEQATLAQRFANSMTDDAYISGATTDAYVKPGEVSMPHKAGADPTAKTRKATPLEMLRQATPRERQQVLREQVSFLRHLLAEFNGDAAMMMRDYRAMKYLGRALDAVQASGVHDPAIPYLRGLTDLVYKVDRSAHSGDAPQGATRGKKANEASVRYNDADATSTAHKMTDNQLNAFALDSLSIFNGLMKRTDTGGIELAAKPHAGTNPQDPHSTDQLRDAGKRAKQEHPENWSAEPGILKSAKTKDGEHEAKINESGEMLLCSECDLALRRYARELEADAKSGGTAKTDIETIKTVLEPAIASGNAAAVETALHQLIMLEEPLRKKRRTELSQDPSGAGRPRANEGEAGLHLEDLLGYEINLLDDAARKRFPGRAIEGDFIDPRTNITYDAMRPLQSWFGPSFAEPLETHMYKGGVDRTFLDLSNLTTAQVADVRRMVAAITARRGPASARIVYFPR